MTRVSRGQGWRLAAFALAITAVLHTSAVRADATPMAVFGAYLKAVNSGDMPAVAALIGSDPGRPPHYSCIPELSNRDCLLGYLDNTVVRQHSTLRSLKTTLVGDVINVELEVRNDLTRAARVSRFTGVDQVTVRDGKIVDFAFVPNLSDAQTVKFFDYMRSSRGPQPGAGPPPENRK